MFSSGTPSVHAITDATHSINDFLIRCHDVELSVRPGLMRLDNPPGAVCCLPKTLHHQTARKTLNIGFLKSLTPKKALDAQIDKGNHPVVCSTLDLPKFSAKREQIARTELTFYYSTLLNAAAKEEHCNEIRLILFGTGALQFPMQLSLECLIEAIRDTLSDLADKPKVVLFIDPENRHVPFQAVVEHLAKLETQRSTSSATEATDTPRP